MGDPSLSSLPDVYLHHHYAS